VVLDLDLVDAAIEELERACTHETSNVEIAYAAKAFICTAFAAHLARRAVSLDVCSLGELFTAERAGFPAARITLHGAGKSDEELQAAAAGRVGCIAIDAVEELDRFAQLARETAACVLLRLNTGIQAHTHSFVRTGGDDTKFGIHPRDEAAAIDILRARPQIRFQGLHAHIGSQIYQSDAFVANIQALVEAAARFGGSGLAAQRVVIGGGFGVQVDPDASDQRLDLAATIEAVVARAGLQASRLGIPSPRIGIEPGRWIVARAGTTLYRVRAVKRQTHRTFVVIDGSMADNPRPALYGAYHHVVAVAPSNAELQGVTICGHSCENDELGPARLPADIRPGDLLAMQSTGAYTYSMAGNYNRFPRPAVVAVRKGSHQTWIRRETLDDVLHLDQREH
jgi:diaminopimelate decarboxylase